VTGLFQSNTFKCLRRRLANEVIPFSGCPRVREWSHTKSLWT